MVSGTMNLGDGTQQGKQALNLCHDGLHDGIPGLDRIAPLLITGGDGVVRSWLSELGANANPDRSRLDDKVKHPMTNGVETPRNGIARSRIGVKALESLVGSDECSESGLDFSVVHFFAPFCLQDNHPGGGVKPSNPATFVGCDPWR